jgi:hypothetical protein
MNSPTLAATVQAISRDRILQHEAGVEGRIPWAVLHDLEGHNVLLLQAKSVSI